MPVCTEVVSFSLVEAASWSFWKTPPAGGEVRSCRVWAATGAVVTLPPENRYTPLYWAFSPSTDWLKALCIEATRPLALPLAMACAIAWRALWPAVDTSVRALSWADSWEAALAAVCT